MEERGVDVDHAILNRWVIEYGPLLAEEAQKRKQKTASSWRMGETYQKVKGRWVYLYRAVDKYGNTLDFMLSERRDEEAAEAFFNQAIGNNGVPEKVVIDKSGPSPDLRASRRSCDDTNQRPIDLSCGRESVALLTLRPHRLRRRVWRRRFGCLLLLLDRGLLRCAPVTGRRGRWGFLLILRKLFTEGIDDLTDHGRHSLKTEEDDFLPE